MRVEKSDDRRTVSRRIPVAPAVVGMVGYAAVASLTRPQTWQATVAVVIPGLIVGLMAIRGPDVRLAMGSSVRRAMILWGAVLLAGLLWEAWAFAHQPSWTASSQDYPTLSVLVGVYVTDPIIRFGAWCLWLWVGWRALRR